MGSRITQQNENLQHCRYIPNRKYNVCTIDNSTRLSRLLHLLLLKIRIDDSREVHLN